MEVEQSSRSELIVAGLVAIAVIAFVVVFLILALRSTHCGTDWCYPWLR